MNSRMQSSFKLLSLLPALVVAAPAAPAPASEQVSILSRDDDHPYYFPLGGIIAIPLAVVALIVVTVGLVRRKFYKPSEPTTQPPTIALAERGRTDTLPVYQREENSTALTTDSHSTSSSGLAKPQDEPPAYVAPPNSSATTENRAAPATNPSSPRTTSTAQNNSTSEEVAPGNGRAS
ncbi:unnamed protein product [Clonostachys solani]|uniref:Uncharacterized protein n=1 Tax=Clonostachys solani TaxID=160281 RepID=A0A9N9Z1T0_9HYPO|nr:unnamed protein product [Clonostachys solani]